jgi:hypothetical protein
MQKEGADSTSPRESVVRADNVSGWEIAGAIGLLLFGVVPLVMGWIFLLKRTFDLQEYMAVTLLGIYAFAVIVTFAIILLWGFRRLELPDKFVSWLGGATVGEVAGMVLFIVKKVFP